MSVVTVTDNTTLYFFFNYYFFYIYLIYIFSIGIYNKCWWYRQFTLITDENWQAYEAFTINIYFFDGLSTTIFILFFLYSISDEWKYISVHVFLILLLIQIPFHKFCKVFSWWYTYSTTYIQAYFIEVVMIQAYSIEVA